MIFYKFTLVLIYEVLFKIKLIKRLRYTLRNIRKLYYSSLVIKESNIIPLNQVNLSGMMHFNSLHYLGIDYPPLEEIDWLRDYSSGYRWGKVLPYYKYVQVSKNDEFDVKHVREINRLHFLPGLAVTELISGEKSSMNLEECLKRWLNVNPFQRSINWSSTMDVSIRAINIALTYFVVTGTNNRGFSEVLTKTLFDHAWHIASSLEGNSWSPNNNHYLSNISALYILAMVLPSSSITRRWLEYSKHSFYREVRRQILPSGLTYERSTSYHLLVTELVLFPIIFEKCSNIITPRDVAERAERAVVSLAKYTYSNGENVNIGDQDSGRVLLLNSMSLGNIDVISLGEKIFGIKFSHIFVSRNSSYNSLIDLLFPSLDLYGIHNKNNALSVEFPIVDNSDGIIKYRDTWAELFFNVANRGMYEDEMEKSIHTHDDLLSVCLSLKGEPLLVDAGTYSYTGNRNKRQHFQSARMHNTVTDETGHIDYPKSENLFSLTDYNKVTWRSLKINENDYLIEGDLCKIKNAVLLYKHKRSIQLLGESHEVHIHDLVSCDDKSKSFSSRLFIPGSLNVNLLGLNTVKVKSDREAFTIYCPNGVIAVSQTQISPAYGVLKDAYCLSVEIEDSKNTWIIK